MNVLAIYNLGSCWFTITSETTNISSEYIQQCMKQHLGDVIAIEEVPCKIDLNYKAFSVTRFCDIYKEKQYEYFSCRFKRNYHQ